jgi:tetratricopeptide (TPR) repeat protein
MAKQVQRRPSPSVPPKNHQSVHQTATRARAPGRQVVGAADARPIRSSYVEAIAVYEQAMLALQRREFASAAEQLSQIVQKYPQEKELAERARLYLALCERHTRPLSAEPRSITERLYAATLALNAAEVTRAIAYLEQVLADDAENDQALYMLAVSHSARGETELAIGYLQRAIATNPENRVLARTDPDLAAIRSDEAVSALLDGPLIAPDGDRRRTSVSRTGR